MDKLVTALCVFLNNKSRKRLMEKFGSNDYSLCAMLEEELF